ncbi:MAG: hypothetical protein IPP90_21100 [Gemmatimonadaceae bacterium]|nr:hypothetical protein [Gemmatimonadaceae bacterium]
MIFINGTRLLRKAIRDLMDRAPDAPLFNAVSDAARQTPGVLAIEKLKIRKSGMGHYVDIHVQAHEGT